MASRLARRFLAKSWPERYNAAQFHFRRALSKLPYLPVPVRLQISPGEQIEFWWSRVVPYHDENRGFLDYWGHDAGDLRFLWKVLQPGMTFIDIGANDGVYSLVAGKKLQAAGSVIAFEPSPREFLRLETHFRLNRMPPPHFRAEPQALGLKSGLRPFVQVTSGDTSRSGFRAPSSGDPVRDISVATTTLDEYVASSGFTQINVIKLDVEGGEMDVLCGATAAIARFRPVFICEVLDTAAEPWGYPARDIVSALAALDYRWFDVSESGLLTPHQMRSEYPRVKNYVAIPREKAAELWAEAGE
jgi:FkbM family methyltransferase